VFTSKFKAMWPIEYVQKMTLIELILNEIIHSDQMRHTPYASAVISMFIPDPAFVKRKVFLA